MAFRRNVGIAVALAVGMAFGYAVRPSAQGAGISERKFRIEPNGQGGVRVTLEGGGYLESASINGSLYRATLYFTTQPVRTNGPVKFLPVDVPKQ